MRVLHLNGGNMYGGVEAVLATLAREGDAAPGMVSEFALCFEGRLSAELRAVGRSPHLLGAARLSRPQTIARVRRALTDLIRSGSFDVVVCHQPWTCVVFAPVIRAAGLPVVLWAHMATRGRHWLERLCRFTRPDLVVCNSRFTAGAVSAWLPKSHIEHVYAPLPTQRSLRCATGRTAVRASVQTDDTDVVLVQASRLEALKGHRVLLAALVTLRDVPGWRCWIVGGAQSEAEIAYLHQLHNIVRRHGLSDRVRFTGERCDVLDVLRAADIYCQPNIEPEGFGLTFVEAMHAGLPVVTSGIGGACEIVDGSCGILTPPGDVTALSRALRRLILDRGLQARLGSEARRRPELLCQVPRQMRQIEAVLGSLSATRSAGHSGEVALR